jgi:hypothetical protein
MRFGRRSARYAFIGMLALACLFVTGTPSSLALSRTADTAAAENGLEDLHAAQPSTTEIPMPEAGRSDGDEAAPDESVPDDVPADDDPSKEESVTKQAPALPIIYDVSKLPEPVQRMRQLIIEAAKTGSLEKLRPLLGTGPTETQLAISGAEGDPIDYLHSVSGDGEGQEVLAILLDVLDAGFVLMDPGTPEETYVWPYFFTTPIDQLTAPQRVELFRIVTAGDYKDMKTFGGYNFYRVGITPDGEWKFFVAGD